MFFIDFIAMAKKLPGYANYRNISVDMGDFLCDIADIDFSGESVVIILDRLPCEQCEYIHDDF